MSDTTTLTPEQIGRWMEQHDRYARLLGMQLEAVEAGYARVSMTVTADMLNSVGVTHGGVTFGMADFAFAVASNAHGTVAVALTAQISYPAAGREGDRLIAEAREESKTRRTGLYTVEVRTGEGRQVGLFTGTVFRRSDSVAEWMNRD
ncbi:MAG: hydroxyphenylacetyl-CoA thioesterase PaaI [Candidatus Sedimenticola sp. PURPLELP]